MLVTVLFLAASLVVLVTLAPLSPSTLWWIRGFDFPRLQITALASLVAIGLLLAEPPQPGGVIALALVSASIVRQLTHILPFCRLSATEVNNARHPADDQIVSVLIANVLMSNRRDRDLVEIVRRTDPDIVLTLETDQWWQQRLATLEERYPWRCQCPMDNLYGMHLYSRLELGDTELRFLVEEGVPSIKCRVRLRNGQRVLFYALHPAPPSPSENTRSTERDGELLIVGREISALGEPAIVTGDLNDVAWSKTTLLFRSISGLLDPRRGRGLYNSFHAQIPIVRWPLDHLFHSAEFRLVDLCRLESFGSDHFPIFVKLAFQPEALEEQVGRDGSAADEQLAQRKIQAAKQRNAD